MMAEASASPDRVSQVAELRMVFMTAPDAASAETLASALVAERLAACVNVLGGVHSTYRWQGEVETAGEVLLIAKTRWEALPTLIRRVEELHPYEVPEVVALPVVGGLGGYLDWVAESVGPVPSGEAEDV